MKYSELHTREDENVEDKITVLLFASRQGYDYWSRAITITIRKVFNRVSKVIAGLLWFCFTITFCDWFKKSRATFSANQMQNQNQSRLGRAHFPAWRRLHVFASSSHCLIVLFTLVVIGHCINCFGFGFTTLN